LAAGCASDGVKAPLVASVTSPVVPTESSTFAPLAPAAPVVAAAPAVTLDPQGLIRKPLLQAALRALDTHGHRIAQRDAIYVVDFRRHSSQERLYRLDLKTGEVQAFRTAHGLGSDPAHTGFAQKFSNVVNSYASSVGAYVTAGASSGAKHGPNVILEGLDPSNNEARDRAIIVHAADYCEPRFLAREGKLGRSNGCFSVSQADLHTLRPIMDAGRLLFAGV
jgi:hypothetical protein